jgi:predicted  nucleic acid-binding Zn ribbon protein
MTYKDVQVMADFSSSGLWRYKYGGMIDYDSLPMSKELIKDFEKWIEFYDRKCTSRINYCVLKEKEEELNNRGRDLARRLKKEIPDIDVYYVGYYSAGTSERSGKPELIEEQE